ncbi:MAG: hypothetical protein OEY06_09640 [Gammaproteobacteria bacterium]|nr:hypothetical protein [Gammaproteobacteria bacterium]
MKIKQKLQTIGLCAAAILLTSCSDNKQYETAICALADISGTYADEKENMVSIIKAGVIPKLVPGDSLFLIAIDSNSYDEENLKGKLTLDYRPSQANKQRMEFAGLMDDFAKEETRAKFTDISGAMMLCSGYLKSTQAGTQIMFIFSDMKEELKPGIKRSFNKDEFTNMNLAAMNVIKLNEDNTDPQVYRSRIKKWEKRVLKHSAVSWNASLVPTDISEYIDNLR